MNTRRGFAPLSAAFVLALTYSQAHMGPLQPLPSHPLPAVDQARAEAQASVDEPSEVLLLAGNTACNPRVTVCEE